MFSKKSVVSLILATTLLVAPATLAAPSSPAGFGWMAYVSAAFTDFLNLFRFDRQQPSTDTLSPAKPVVSGVCGELGAGAEPSGCPG